MISPAVRLDRACGVLLGTAAGDALGAPFEFGPPLGAEVRVDIADEVNTGTPWKTGEWTDDTSMAIAIAEVAATGVDLRDESAQDAIVARWRDWAHDPKTKDVGIQTRAVLGHDVTSAAAARAAAEAVHRATGRSGGNGSLMRTAPVALAYLDDDDERAMVAAAREISALTHYEPDNADACVLWCAAIRHAVLTGDLDVRVGLRNLDAIARERWSGLIDEAERCAPADFDQNGWVVQALQGAWSAISNTAVPQRNSAAGVFPADQLRLGLQAAVRGGRDTDTVAAIAGGLLGAAHGASAVPAQWRRRLHGWPGLRRRGLIDLAGAVVRGGAPDPFDFSYPNIPDRGLVVQHPADDEVWMGGVRALRSLPTGVGAVVSLCRVGDADLARLPADAEHLDVRLIDQNDANPNLDFVLDDTVRAIQQYRAEGKGVFFHCVQAQSRTPTVSALYGARTRGVSIAEALRTAEQLLPGASPRQQFIEALHRLRPDGQDLK